jgi:predicted RNase H-like HicB family nuclease
MKQYFHTIFRPDRDGWFVGWVEEIPGTITYGKSLEDCRRNLEDALRLMLETHRDEARRGLAPGCIQETMEIESTDDVPLARQVH